MLRLTWKPLLIACLCLLLRPVAGVPAAPLLADQSFAQGDFEAARRAYAAAAPGEAAPRLGLIRALLRLDRWAEAQSEAQAAVREFPSSADAHGLLALALIRAGWQPPYADEAGRSLSLDPGDYWGLVASGRAAEWDGRFEDARGLFRRASAARPDLPDALLGLLGVLDGKHDPSEVAAVRAKYLSLRPRGQPHDRAVAVLQEETRTETEAGAQAAGEGGTPRAATQPGPAVLTVDFVGDYAVFPVTINGGSLRLLFDTGGGSGVLLSRDAARRLHLPVVGRTVIYGAHGHENADVLRADTLTLGGQVYRSPHLLAVEVAPASTDGILSGSVLGDSVLTLDFEQRKATLTQRAGQAPAPLPGDHAIALPWHTYRQHLFLRVSVHSAPLWAMLDTGDYQTILSLALASEQLKGVSKEEVRRATVHAGPGTAIGNSAPKEEYIVSRAESQVSLGADPPAFIPFPIVGVSVLDRQASPDFDFEIPMLLGMSSLTYARRVTFDYRRRLFTFEYRDPEAEPEPKKK